MTRVRLCQNVALLSFAFAFALSANGQQSGDAPNESLKRTAWMRQARWGVMTHFLADWQARTNNFDISVDQWNRMVDAFDEKRLADQLKTVGAGFLILTLGQNSGYYLAPNPTYDRVTGIQPSKCSRRDLVSDMAAALAKRGIKLIVYLPSGAPAGDRAACEALRWQNGMYANREFQIMWEQIISDWSKRFGDKVAGWWFDGCYWPNSMYRSEQPPNFRSFAQAARAGNPNSALAFNPGVVPRLISMTPHEDYTAGEISNPERLEIRRSAEGILDGKQVHVLTYLGTTWGMGEPRFAAGQAVEFSRTVWQAGGVISWDVPVGMTGLISDPFLAQLKMIAEASTKKPPADRGSKAQSSGRTTGSPLPAEWSEVAPGVWKSIVGQPEAYDLLKAADASPARDGFTRIQPARFPLPTGSISVNVKDGQTHLRFPLDRDEQIYGFGLNFKTIHQRGRILQLHVDHYGGKDDGRTHAPVPFYVSSRGYGVFVNSARYIRVWAGTGVRRESPEFPQPLDRNTDKGWSARPYSDSVEILVPAAGVEIYIFGGPKALDAVRRYNLFTGGGCLPPRWGLGFSHRVPRLHDANQVLTEAREFSERGFPLDVIGLEPGWQSKSYPCTFVWDKRRFPAPADFVQRMADMGIRVNLWTNPYVSPESPVYDSLLPLSSSHTVWLGVVPDFTLPKAVETLVDLFRKEHVDIGVSGYKIDETDGYDHYLWPDVATFPSGLAAEQIRQTYGVLLQKATARIYREKNRRTYGLTRATNAGATSFPYVIYNDYYSHEDFITALCNSGFTGVLWTPEVRSSEGGEEWLRRMQSVCFSPMAMLNAWASGTKPWSFPEVERQVREAALLRMRLLPYFYTEFARYRFDGLPPFRAMALEEGFAPEEKREENKVATLQHDPYQEAIRKEVKDQYMAGEYLLVAPMFKGQESRRVALPRGKWYDFYTGRYAGGGEVISVTPGLDQIPVFVKDGGIVPMMPAARRAPGRGQKFDLEIRHYGEKESVSRLYDDDGETFDYEKGAYAWRELRVRRGADGRLVGAISPAPHGKPDNVGRVAWTFMTR